MKAVIMAGGEGSRLRPLTCDRPKPLVPICNRPVMAYILDLLAFHGVREVFVTLGYMPEPVTSAFGPAYRGMAMHYLVERTPLGTAGSVAALRERLDEPFFVLSGDALTDLDLTAMMRFHREAGAVATLAMSRVERPLEYGVILTDRRGRIRRFLEKPGWGEVFSDTVNTGIYVLEPAALDGVPAGRPYDFSRHLFPALLRLGVPLYGVEPPGYWCDIGDPGAYRQSSLDLLTGRLRFDPPGTEAVPGVWVAGEPPAGVLLEGPVLIGPGCRLEPGARLEAGVVLGQNCQVRREAVLRESVLWDEVEVGAGALVMGAVCCQGARVGARAGLFPGAVAGPGCEVGEQATVAPGVRLWPGTAVAAGAQVEQTLTRSPLWSGRPMRQGRLVGRLGEDLFAESAVRSGSAFAAALTEAGPVLAGADRDAASQLLRQALVCGLLAAGRDVWLPPPGAWPVTAHLITLRGAAGGLHVQTAEGRSRVRFYGADGRPLVRELERQLEQACLRLDFHRAGPAGAGRLEPLPDAEALYLTELSRSLQAEAIRRANLRVALAEGCWPLLERWLKLLGCAVEPPGAAAALTLEPDLDEAGWRVAGLSPEQMLALRVRLTLQGWPAGEPVPVPVTVPRGVEAMVREAGLVPQRVRIAQWRPGDPVLALGRLLLWLAEDPSMVLASRLPAAATARQSLHCPWALKGWVMRRLLEEHAQEAGEQVEGVRLERPDGWALLLPDPEEPVCHIHVEAEDPAAAVTLAQEYCQQVQALLRGAAAGEPPYGTTLLKFS